MRTSGMDGSVAGVANVVAVMLSLTGLLLIFPKFFSRPISPLGVLGVCGSGLLPDHPEKSSGEGEVGMVPWDDCWRARLVK